MEPKEFEAFPTISLVLYFNRAIDDSHWLEAIVLAHMYIETQLRTILGKDVRQAKRTKKDENVIGLAKKALKKNKLKEDLFRVIEQFNAVRNDAVHHLAIGTITYGELEPMARQAGSLIMELQSLYAYKPFEPEKED